MTDRDSWPFDDDDRAERLAALELASRLDRARKRQGAATMARLRYRRVKPTKPKGE